MTTLSLSGVRGGVGTTSLLAALGFALQSLGERVLMIDLCPENQLRLHCNLPLEQASGWARAMLDDQPWHEHAWRLNDHLHLLPYGRLSSAQSLALEQRLLADPQLWARRQARLAGQYDWLLFDLPQRLPGHAACGPCLLPVRVAESDPACLALLQQARQAPGHVPPLLLVNRFDPGSQLQRDLLLVWRNSPGSRLLPLTVHSDEAMREAMAFRQPVGQYAPDSLAAQDALSLATWCLTRRQALEAV
ncbi:cellulose synthase operon protein YhjQ [Pseudomonas syringae]|nr:cellulose synthase operon protein YhjQ [Pseudomonas syringae]MBD8577326.1 cellulose synthase operon protein YhjQ [Pseudomonas syringae]MBD8793150.1 cellulose synthase operon protein YhjQ [Pseudomonas syringae]MBD8802877.1 cellulose synthase operon protein YhjQ [Pseudomonas syringae]MBD8813589.1 cellulose synthase operon protein YhjQ [Pseudomonas syringae]